MSVKGICIITNNIFATATNYIDKNGNHPKHMEAIGWNKLVFKKEELNDSNWLYIGDATKEEKENQLKTMEEHKGWVPIFK